MKTTKITTLILLVVVAIVAVNVLTFVGCDKENSEETVNFVATA